MKNWKKASIGALCVVSLLAGCGTQGGDTNNNDKTPTSRRKFRSSRCARTTFPKSCSKITTR